MFYAVKPGMVTNSHFSNNFLLIGGVSGPGTAPPDEVQEKLIEEIDEDGSGTMDFDEFCQMMMS